MSYPNQEAADLNQVWILASACGPSTVLFSVVLHCSAPFPVMSSILLPLSLPVWFILSISALESQYRLSSPSIPKGTFISSRFFQTSIISSSFKFLSLMSCVLYFGGFKKNFLFVYQNTFEFSKEQIIFICILLCCKLAICKLQIEHPCCLTPSLAYRKCIINSILMYFFINSCWSLICFLNKTPKYG